MKNKNGSAVTVIVIVGAIIVLALIGIAGYFWYQSQQPIIPSPLLTPTSTPPVTSTQSTATTSTTQVSGATDAGVLTNSTEPEAPGTVTSPQTGTTHAFTDTFTVNWIPKANDKNQVQINLCTTATNKACFAFSSKSIITQNQGTATVYMQLFSPATPGPYVVEVDEYIAGSNDGSGFPVISPVGTSGVFTMTGSFANYAAPTSPTPNSTQPTSTSTDMTITNISPTSGIWGSQGTITGSGFDQSVYLSWVGTGSASGNGERSATGMTVTSATSLTFTVPQLVPGTYTVNTEKSAVVNGALQLGLSPSNTVTFTILPKDQ